jgi:sugar phosphate permease
LIPIVFHKMGTVNVFLSTLIVNSVGLISNFVVIMVMDRIPRVPHLAVSYTAAAIATVLIGISNNYIAIVVVAMISNFLTSFPWGTFLTLY